MKKVCAAAFILMFLATTASMSFAAKVKCEVTAVDGDTVTLTCEGKGDKFKVEDKLKITPAKKGAAVEGC
jgi:Spy/CpxP family protein refolding chaperone